MKLLQELFAQGLLTEQSLADLKKQSEKSGKTEEEIILEKRIVPENSLFEMKSKIFGVPLKMVKAEDVSSDVLELMPEEAAVNYKMMPISKTNGSAQIGMVYPENISAQNALRFLANQENFTYQVYLITPSTLANLLKQRRNISAETKKALEELNKEKGGILDVFSTNLSTEAIAEEAPIIKMVLVILRHAIEGNASDIHIEPSRDKLNVRFRLTEFCT